MKLPTWNYLSPGCFILEILQQLYFYHILKWEWNKTNTNLFKSITNNIAPSVSITWHKRNPWVVLNTYIDQLMTHTTYVYIAAAYLAIMLLSLLAYCRGYLRVKGYTYIIWTRQKIVPFLSEKLTPPNFQKFKFQKFKFSGLMKRYQKFRPYQFAVFKKEMFLFCPYEET